LTKLTQDCIFSTFFWCSLPPSAALIFSLLSFSSVFQYSFFRDSGIRTHIRGLLLGLSVLGLYHKTRCHFQKHFLSTFLYKSVWRSSSMLAVWLCNFLAKEITNFFELLFCNKVLWAAFRCFQFGFVIFWHKENWRKSCS